MIDGKKVIVVMPAYNAAQTVKQTFQGLDLNIIDEVILVDDHSRDETIKVAEGLDIITYAHEVNKGYGGNQKTCYALALKRDVDVCVMVHPDYQYDPRLAVPLAGMVASGVYDCAIASRITGGYALKGGMPFYKYIANRLLTLFQNILIKQKLSEYHTGYRAFSRRVIEELPLLENSDDFIFDNQMLAQVIYFGYSIGEISCPTRYFEEASSINFLRSCRYGLGVLFVSLAVFLQRTKLFSFSFLNRNGNKLKI